MDRRAFLAMAAAGVAHAQAPLSVLPFPAKSKITSAAMLWTLPGTFEQRVRIAAEAGLQGVGLRDEYTRWDPAQLVRAKRYIESFGLVTETLRAPSGGGAEAFLNNVRGAIELARKLESRSVTVVIAEQYPGLVDSMKQAGALASASEVVLLLEPLSNKQGTRSFLSNWAEGVQLVKEIDHPNVRLLCSVYEEQLQAGTLVGLPDALEYSACITLADAPGRVEPGTGSLPLKDVYRTLQKKGYNQTVAMEYTPKGDPVASLRRAVDQFRAVVNERSAPSASPLNPTEGPLV